MDSVTFSSSTLSYRDAGVDIDAGNRLVERIKPYARQTRRPEVLGGLGGFGALFELPSHRYREPVLVASTDGVGTKLRLARALKRHDTIGIDLVAMCVNDVLVVGAEPLFFLDYYATGKLEVDVAAEVIKGIADGCGQAGTALVGGETAEMPGMYQLGDYDLAGFYVGVVEKTRIIDGRRVQPGDVLLGLASSGPHANGYSLIRKILEICSIELEQPFAGTGQSLGTVLLAPTRIYVKSVSRLLETVEVHAMAHITGGGLPDNVPRVLPHGVKAQIAVDSWPRPAVFRWLQQHGGVSDAEMWRTFNCGIGMVLCVGADQANTAMEILRTAGETVWQIGRIVVGVGAPVVEFVQ